ncbi:addiction module toxin RelE [Listeria booriae]|uniref:Addiction module toxin RelE n=1 Tax=Listeria booriae TaxID=1552123 RepID=A0A842EZX0_9LIST|nr:addiction module toxin RelE [Listeria booriae]MBC2242234.1 addiction module toxin RelE [Listeria booriae]
MATEKKRIKVAVTDETLEKLDWLLQEDKKKATGKRVYACDVLERLIAQEYKIRKVFR